MLPGLTFKTGFAEAVCKMFERSIAVKIQAGLKNTETLANSAFDRLLFIGL